MINTCFSQQSHCTDLAGLPNRLLAWIFAVLVCLLASIAQAQQSIQLIDLNEDADRQVLVDQEAGQYLGHPTTLLLEDGKTILCVYPKGHGRGSIIYKRSIDGGKTWSNRLETPESWSTSKETPTLHRVVDSAGKKRVIMFSGLYPARMAISEDDGESWSELQKVGDWGGIVVMGCLFEQTTGPGHYMAMFHDDGRFIASEASQKTPREFALYRVTTVDGGVTWSDPVAIRRSTEKHICEPGVIRSPDGRQLAALLRENSRRHNSQIIFSQDEGETWSEPRDLPDPLNGDRHTAQYGPDGRLFISYRRRMPKDSEKCQFEGDWVGWVGTYDDLLGNHPGQYLVRLKDNKKTYDCAYPGVEILPDGTLVTTTYGHWDEGEEPFIYSVRLKLNELDELAEDN